MSTWCGQKAIANVEQVVAMLFLWEGGVNGCLPSSSLGPEEMHSTHTQLLVIDHCLIG